MSDKLIPGRIAIGGSRSLSSLHVGAVRSVTRGLLDAGYSLRVGCAVGVDAAVIGSVPPAMVQSCHVFAAFGPTSPPYTAPQGRYSAPGAWSGSAVATVARHVNLGGPVTWWAGGGQGVPGQARLAARTRAMVAQASAGCVVFFSDPGSRGSALCARSAAARGLPVFAWPLGFSGLDLPSLGSGSWSRFSVPSPLAGCYIWQAWAHKRY